MASFCHSVSLSEGIGSEYKIVANRYSLEGWNRLEKHWEYIRKGDRSSIFALSFLVAAGAVSGGVLGATLTGVIPLTIGLIDPNYSESVKVSRIRGLIGKNFGCFSGGMIGAYLYMSVDERFGPFKNWYLQGLTNDMVAVIRSRYMTDPVLSSFECAISKDFMLFPVFSPTGTLYDLPELLKLPRDLLGRVDDPLRNPPFIPENTAPWFELGYLTNKRIIFLIKRDMYIFVAPIDRAVRERLADVLGVLEREAVHCYEKSKNVIENKRRDEELSRNEYMGALSAFFDAFGDSPSAELDWEKPWKEVLEDRLLGCSGKAEKKERRNSIPIDRGMIKQT